MRYYAIADLHGRYDLLEKAFCQIGKDADGPCKIITLGDYIDRGSASKQVIQGLIDARNDLSSAEFPLEDIICLKGNHEDMAVQTITQPLLPMWWMGNGGHETLQSYKPDCFWGETGAMDRDHVRWMGSLPQYYETEKHVFIHAGVPEEVNDLDAQDPEQQMWMLYRDHDEGGYRGKHVVHGHHQFADGPHEWSGRTDLDTFAWKTGRLVVGVFDDSQHKALRFIEVLGDDYDHQRAGVE